MALSRNRTTTFCRSGCKASEAVGRHSFVLAVSIYICLTSLSFISGLSTSHSSRRTAHKESPTITERPKLHTKVMA